jgi:hypothetical protein
MAKNDRIVVTKGYICLVSKDGARFHIGRQYYGHLRYALNLSDMIRDYGKDSEIDVVELK